MKLYLASSSPRRVELLSNLGIKFQQLKPDIAEHRLVEESAPNYVKRMALLKAHAGWDDSSRTRELPVIGADTIVAINKHILGKPHNAEQACEMLTALSGRSHCVYSGIAVLHHDRYELAVSVSKVQFRELTKQEIQTYVDTGEPLDKAGAYAVQGKAALFISRIEGSYSGIVGLPLYELGELLAKFDIKIF